MHLTVGKLKEKIKDLPDDLPVGKIGHFGEALLCEDYDIRVGHGYFDLTFCDDLIDIKMLVIEIPDRGTEPE